MSKFFDVFPIIPYDISGKQLTNYESVRNIFFRLRVVREVINNISAYYEYIIKDGETPEKIAEIIYNDPGAHWIVLMANDIIDAAYDWPLDYDQFNNYIVNKFKSAAAQDLNISINDITDSEVIAWSQSSFHHYEKVITREEPGLGLFLESRFVINEKPYSNVAYYANTTKDVNLFLSNINGPIKTGSVFSTPNNIFSGTVFAYNSSNNFVSLNPSIGYFFKNEKLEISGDNYFHSNLRLKTEVGTVTSVANLYHTPNKSNLILRTGWNTTNIANLYYDDQQTSNLLFKTDVGATVSRGNLYYLPQTSNLLFKTGKSFSTNIANLYYFPQSYSLGDIFLKTNTQISTSHANLFYNAKTANLLLKTANNVVSNVANFYNPLTTYSVILKTKSDPTVANLYYHPERSNLTIKTGPGLPTNVANFYTYETSDLILKTGWGEYLTQIRFYSTPSISNLTLKTSSGGPTNIANLYLTETSGYITLKTNSDASSNVAYLYYTPTSNLILRTGPGDSVNVANLYILNLSNLTVSTGAGDSVNVVNLSEWAGNSSISFANGDYITINGITANVENTWAESKTIYISPAIPGNLIFGTLQVYVSVTANSSNVPFSNNNIIVDDVEVNVANTWADSSSIWLSPALSGNLFSYSVRVYTPVAAGNTDITFANGYILSVNDADVNIENTSFDSSIVYLSPALPGNIVSETIKTYIPAWAGNSAIEIANGHLIAVDGFEVNVENTWANSSTIWVSPMLSDNITSDAILVYPSAQVGNSSILFSNGNLISANNSDANVENTWAESSTVWVSPGLPGNITCSAVRIYTSVPTNTSIAQFANGYHLVINDQEVNVENTWAESSSIWVSPALTDNTVSDVVDIFRPFWAGNADVSIDNNSIIVWNSEEYTITNASSNLNTIYLSPGLVDNIKLTSIDVYEPAWTTNCNISLDNNNILILNSNEYRIVNLKSNSSSIYFNTELSGDLELTDILVYQSAWIQNTGAIFNNNSIILLNGKEYTISNVVQNSSLVNLYPQISDDVQTSLVQLHQPIWAGNSSISFANGDLLIINGNNYIITHTSFNSSSIYVTPKLNDNAITSEVQVYRPAWAGNSSAVIANNYLMTIDGVNVDIVDARSNSSTVYFYPEISGNITSSLLQTQRSAWAGNSIESFSNTNLIILNGNNYTLLNTRSNSSSIWVSPELPSNSIISDIEIYKLAWAQNSNITFGNNSTVLVTDLVNTIANSNLYSSIIYFSSPITPNLMNSGLQIYKQVNANISIVLTPHGSLISNPLVEYSTYEELAETQYVEFFNMGYRSRNTTDTLVNSGRTLTQTTFRDRISYYDYEYALNERKRTIKIIKPEYYSQILDEFNTFIEEDALPYLRRLIV